MCVLVSAFYTLSAHFGGREKDHFTVELTFSNSL